MSFLRENLSKHSIDIQREVPIKSVNSFLFEYWNVFFYLYSKKLLEKFKNNKSEEGDQNILNALSFNNLFNNNKDIQIKENENKDINKINNNNQNFNSGINCPPSNNIKSSLFQPQNNNPNNPVIGNNYIYPSFPGLVPNPQNDLFINQLPRISSIPNNLSMNSFYTSPKLLQNNFGNDRSNNIFGDIDNNINNLEPPNVTFFQMPIQNQISFNPMSNSLVSGKIIPNNVPNFMITNSNTNINTNSNVNINKNINNIINLDNKNIINNNINNNININANPNVKLEKNNNYNNNTSLNNTQTNDVYKKADLDTKIKFTSINIKNKNQIDTNKKKEKPKNISTQEKTEVLIPIKKKQTPLFTTHDSTLKKEKDKDKDKDSEQNSLFTSKKRKRFIKNNKLVFVQLNKNSENKEEKNESEEKEENNSEEPLSPEKAGELIQKKTKPRGSRYRGVSKNGSQWQVLIMVEKKKRYLGSFSNEEEAARAYDKVALQHHGIKAKTNYDYTKEQVEKIMAGPKLLKLD